MNKKLAFITPLAVFILSGCFDQDNEIKVDELGGHPVVIDQNSGQIYRLQGQNLIALERVAKSLNVEPTAEVIQSELDLRNNVYADSSFKIESGKVRYIIRIKDREYTELVSRARVLAENTSSTSTEKDVGSKQSQEVEDLVSDLEKFSSQQDLEKLLTDLKSYDSNALKVIRAVASSTSDSDRFDRINLTFRDSDGFKVADKSIVLSNSQLTQVMGVHGDLTGLRLEGEIVDSELTPDLIDTVTATYNGFELD